MGHYRLDSLEQLARQMDFAPTPRRLEQLDAAEALLLTITPDKTYSDSQVICAVTGYQIRHEDGALIAGEALQHDLGLLLEDVSESLQLHANASTDRVLTIEEVAQRLSVTTKTVQRWRRRGLPARRYTFADGKRRIGFQARSLQRFVGSANGTQQVPPIVATGRDLGWLLARCQELAAAGFWDTLAGQRLSPEAGLSPLTIAQLVREHSPSIVFAAEPGPATRSRIMEMRQNGDSIRHIAALLSLPAYGVYRVIVEQKLHAAIRKPIRFYDDPLYHRPDASEAVDAIIDQDAITVRGPEERIPRDLPPYLRELYRIPLLSANRERGLFLKYHYLRLLAAQQQTSLDPTVSSYRALKRFEILRRSARLIRAKIVEANLRLVVSVARKHMRPSVSLMELVSEGNLTLIRAVDSFDVHRGHRFSTYAVYALMRGFARYVPAALAGQRQLTSPEVFAAVRDPATSRAADQTLARDEVSQLLTRLEPREREIVAGRYGIGSPEFTGRELGQRLHLSSQRIVQIEQQAMSKLRSH